MGTMKTLEEHRAAAPAIGTPEWDIWMAGAAAEAASRRQGVTDENRELVDTIDALRECGDSAEAMLRFIIHVFGPGLPWSTRWRAAWNMVRGYRRRRRWHAEMVWEKRDLWVGVYWDRDDSGLHLWVAIVPVIVLHVHRDRR